MLLRTLEIPDAQGLQLNAVLLCGFTANAIDRQFLVYSLNEKLVDDLIKIYLAPIEGAGLKMSMCSASAEVFTNATQVLKNIIRDACSPQARQYEHTYAVLDLKDSDIQCTAMQAHHSLKISEAWMMKLLAYDPEPPLKTGVQAQKQPLPETLKAHVEVQPARTQYQAAPTPLRLDAQHRLLPPQPVADPSGTTDELPYRVISPAPTSEQTRAESEDVTPQTSSHSEKIETNLKSLIASVTQHKETLLGKFVMINERLRELEDQEQQLATRERSLVTREEELNAGINALQFAEQQLSLLMRDA